MLESMSPLDQAIFSKLIAKMKPSHLLTTADQLEFWLIVKLIQEIYDFSIEVELMH